MGSNVCSASSTDDNVLIIDKIFKQYQISSVKEKQQQDAFDEFEINMFLGDVHYVHAANIQAYDKLCCIDGRGQNEGLGCPGGDSSMFLLGLTAYEELSQKQLSQNQVKYVMDKFLNSRKQPMYLHSDFHALEHLFQHLNKHVTMKWEMEKEIINASPQLQTQLIPLITKPEYIGCGHIKNTISNSAYITRKQLVEYYLLNFFDLLWKKDKRVQFEVLDGDHSEKAVCIFESVTTTKDQKQSQSKFAPLVKPFNQNQNQSCFIYHPGVEELFRLQLAKLLCSQLQCSFNAQKLMQKMKEIGKQQLDNTVQKLASKLPIYNIKFT